MSVENLDMFWESEDLDATATLLTGRASAPSLLTPSAGRVSLYGSSLTGGAGGGGLVSSLSARAAASYAASAAATQTGGTSSALFSVATAQAAGMPTSGAVPASEPASGEGSDHSLSADVYDAAGSNGSRATATALPSQAGTLDGLTIHTSSDYDYFALTLLNDGTDKNIASIVFDAAQGELDLHLVSSNGAIVRTGTATADGKQLDFNGLAAGKYYIRAMGVSGAQNTYSLTWDGNNYGMPVDVYDAAGSNGSRATASALPSQAGTLDGLTIHNGSDYDYFALTLLNGGTARNIASIVFDAAQGELDLHLVSSNGAIVRTGTATADGKQFDFNGLAAGKYYIRVMGASGAQNTYSLTWDGNNYGMPIDVYDMAGSNGSRATATVLPSQAGTLDDLSIHNSSDYDYFALTLSSEGTASNIASIVFDAAQGELDLHLVSSNGAIVRTGTATADGKQLDFDGLAAGKYYIRIMGASGAQNTYSLTWDGNNYGMPIDVYDMAGSNGSRATATVLPSQAGTLDDLSIHNSSDYDYFALTLSSEGTASNIASIVFDAAQGELDLHLVSSNGAIVRTGTATADGKQLDFDGLAAGKYYIRIMGASGAQNTYSLTWDGTIPTGGREDSDPAVAPAEVKADVYDAAGSNGSRAAATALPSQAGRLDGLTIHTSSDYDYFALTLLNDGTDKNIASIVFDAAQGELDLHLVSSNGAILRTGTATADGKQLDFNGLAAGKYYIRAMGVSGALNTYSLIWDGNNYGLPADVYDAAGSNGSRAAATVLPQEAGTLNDLSIHTRTDYDYFALTLINIGMDKNVASIAFDAAQGELDLHLISSNGAILRTGTATADGKQIDLSGLAAGKYYVRVMGVSGAQNTYSLTWDSSNYGLPADVYDTAGSNGSRAAATALPSQAGTLNDLSIHTSTDYDYFALTLTNDGTAKNMASIAFDAAQGDLDLHLISSNGAILRTGTATADGKQLDFNGLAAGKYYVRVMGVSGAQNTYSLTWDGNNYGLPADVYDAAGSNGSRPAATALPSQAGTLDDLTIHTRTDYDYFALTLTSSGTAKNIASIAFDAAQGDLDLHLISSNGAILRTGTATADGKQLDFSGLAAGKYYVRVMGVSGAQNTYSLTWDGTSSTGGGEETDPGTDPAGVKADVYDATGSNGSRAAATVLPSEAGTLNDLTIHTSSDYDYFALTLTNDGTAKNIASIAFDAAKGDLDLHIISSNGAILRTGTTTADGKQLDFNGLAAGKYYVRVMGVSGALNTYSLTWDGNNYGLPADVYDTGSSNESRTTATVLPQEAGTLDDLSIHTRTDYDYFALTLSNDGTVKNIASIAFDAAQGELALHLISSSGAILRTGTATADGKQLDLSGLAAGKYYVRVMGVSGAQNTYSLTWDGRNYGLPADVYDTGGSNESRTTATVLPQEAGTLDDLSIHTRTDYDYFALTLSNDGTVKNIASIAFDAAQGDLTLHLISSGGAIVRTGTATADGKQLDMSGLAAGTYYIRVQGVSGAQNTYSLTWDGRNYGLPADIYDTGGANDTRTTATVLPQASGTFNDLSIHSRTDNDYFAFTLLNDGTARNVASIVFDATLGDLNLHLLNASGTAVKTGTATADGKAIDLNGLAAGTYYIRVQGVSGAQNTYSLIWDGNNYGLPTDVYDTDGSNESRATATVLPELAGKLDDLTIHSRTDNDYFAFTLANDGTAKNVASIIFDATKGDLNLHLINASGAAVRTGTATADGKQLDLSGLAVGTYYIRVQGVSGVQNTYSLVWDGNNYGPKADIYDTDASNDTRATATVLPGLTGTLEDLSIHSSTDNDYFAFRLANDGTEQNIVSIAFDADMGNLTLQLLNANGTAVRTGTVTESGKQMVLDGLAAGSYYIRVLGASKAKNGYSLTWDGSNYGYRMDVYDTSAPNDAVADAVTLEQDAGKLDDLTIHNGTDKDYFALTLINDATAQNFVSIAFDATQGDLYLHLMNAKNVAVRTGVATEDGKRIDLSGLAPGTYYVRVMGISKAMNTYSLTWDGSNYGLPTDVYDTGASNEVVADAVDPGQSAGSLTDLTIHSSVDKDYFVFELANTGTVRNYVRIDYDGEQGDLSLVVMKANGTLVKTATLTDGGREANLSDIAAGTYYIRVMGVSKATNTYTLSWDGNDYTLPADIYDTAESNNNVRTRPVALESPVDAITDLTIHSSTDVDFYSIQLTDKGAAQNFVRIAFDPALGALELDLLTSAGALVRAGVNDGDGIRIDMLDLAAGTYIVRVRGTSKAQNTYSLSWDRREPRHTPDIYDTNGNNDSTTNAVTLAEAVGSRSQLSIHSDVDVDYFRLDVPAGGGTARNYALLEFDSAVADLSFSLVNAQGVEVLSAETVRTGKRIDLSSLAAGSYYLRITTTDGAANLYTLSWDNTDYTLNKDAHDTSSRNDSIGSAVRLGQSGSRDNLTIHDRSDVDYFRIDLTATGTERNYFSMLYDASLGDLQLELYAADGTRLSGSRAINGGRQVDLSGLAAGAYYLKISGIHHAVSRYSLVWDGETYQSPTITAPIPLAADVYDIGTNNNSRTAAVTLSPYSDTQLSLSIHTSGDMDYFRLVLPSTGAEENYARIFFDAHMGDLALTLISSNGAILIDDGTVIDGGKELNLAGLAAGTYYVRISGINKSTNTYSLVWDRSNYCVEPDKYDASDTPNDTLLTATILPGGSKLEDMSIHSATDADYYSFTLVGGGDTHNAIRLTYDTSLCDLDIRVYDAFDNEVGTLLDIKTGKELSLNGLAAGIYYLRINGVNGSTGYYDLAWNIAETLSLRTDRYEGTKGNNTMDTAVNGVLKNKHSSYFYGYTTITPGDVDYFKFTLTARGGSVNHVSIYNVTGSGELLLDLLDEEGNVLRKAVAVSERTRKISLEGLWEGTYYARIYGETENTYGTYDFQYNLYSDFPSYTQRLQPTMWGPDRYEGNDDMASATNIFATVGSSNMLSIHSAADVDYFRLTLTGTGSVANYVRIQFTQSWGDLGMELYDSAGRRILTALTATGEREISLNGLAAGTYYVKVSGVDDQYNAYTLDWDCSDASLAVPGTADAVRLTVASGTQTLTRQQEARYYAFDLSSLGMADNHISVTTDEALRLSLLNAAGEEIYSTTNRTKLTLSGLDAGTYYLRVEALDFSAGDTVSYTLSHDLTAYSSTAEIVCGKDKSSLFAIRDSGTEYAYLMGYGNVTWDDFTTGSQPYSVNPLYFDAEKSSTNGRDDLLCWAGTTSNMLAWSGWGEIGLPEATGDNAEDVIFTKLINSFPDEAGFIEDGLCWFFSTNYRNYSNSNTASSGSGNYIGQSVWPGISMTTLNSASAMDSLAAALENNMAVGLSMGFYNSLGSSARTSGHDVTVWGYTYNAAKEKGTGGYYTGLLITDSDDNKTYADPTDAPDALHLLPLKWSSSINRYYTSYYSGTVTKLEDFVALPQVSDWPEEVIALAQNSAATANNDLDSLMSAAMQPNAGTLLASAELTPSSDSDTRKQQATLVA